MRLLICAGGTGGVYPALTVTESSEHTDILWVGSEGGMEASSSRGQICPTAVSAPLVCMAFRSGNCLAIW